jgi:hypothetical protein
MTYLVVNTAMVVAIYGEGHLYILGLSGPQIVASDIYASVGLTFLDQTCCDRKHLHHFASPLPFGPPVIGGRIRLVAHIRYNTFVE